MDLSIKFNQARLGEFAEEIIGMSDQIGFKVSARGWGYLLEQAGFITKTEFDKVENLINACRRSGLLAVDFVAEEDARAFRGVEEPTNGPVRSVLQSVINEVLNGDPTSDRRYDGDRWFTPAWWKGETYYIQMLVEKIDLKTLFAPVCSEFHIPIANSKGWSSILQRAEYARRFKAAEQQCLDCVLLYCGDHDPDGLRISDTIRKNLEQIEEIQWSDGETGYCPVDLKIVRFGLNYDFIAANNYTWIDNLITGSGGNLASPSHRNYGLPYVQRYLREFGARKCEANAIVTTPKEARALCQQSIENIVGKGALRRFKKKRKQVADRWTELLDEHDLVGPMQDCIDTAAGDDEEF